MRLENPHSSSDFSGTAQTSSCSSQQNGFSGKGGSLEFFSEYMTGPYLVIFLMVFVLALAFISLVNGSLTNLLMISKSLYTQLNIVSTKLAKGCDAERIVDPFTTPPFIHFPTSLLGVVPKKDPSEFRLIHRLSYHEASSINDFIPNIYPTVKYAAVGDALKSIKRLGCGYFMAKTYFTKSAFRIIPIHPADYFLLGMKMG